MVYSRREFLSHGIGVGVGTVLALRASADGQLEEAGGPPRRYKIVYNWDGAPLGYSEFPQSLDEFVHKTFAPLKGTQVGALFWCLGEHEASWDSKNLPIVGDSLGRTYSSVHSMRHNENIRDMIQRGENPFQALVKRGRELGIDVYASIRMNDNHFGGLQLDEMPHKRMEGLTQLRKAHPEWCLGPERAPKWFAASWNMAIPEVREHRFQYIREALDLADWDGVELDWQRHGFHLPADDAHRLRYALTDLQRAIRRRTSVIARKRKRPFHVAVRVATTMESCRRIGYDLKTWVKEGLCDIIAAGGGAGTDPGIEVEAFRKLIKGTSIHFYTGFDSGFWGEHDGLAPRREWQRAWVRGTAAGYWRRGADGMYVFNWHANERTRRDLFMRIGEPKTLERTDKVFAAVHRHVSDKDGDWGGADLNDRVFGETPVALYRTLTEEGPSFHITLHDDIVHEAKVGHLKRLELRIALEHLSPADRIQVDLDGKKLRKPVLRYVAREDDDNPSDVGETGWLVWSLRPEEATQGPHQIKVRLVSRDPRVEPPLVVKHVEFHVKYG